MKIYKFRAEFMDDVVAFQNVVLFRAYKKLCEVKRMIVLYDSSFSVAFPEIEVEVETDLTIHGLRDILLSIMDGHVMAQSINLSHRYDGERYWEGSPSDPNEENRHQVEILHRDWVDKKNDDTFGLTAGRASLRCQLYSNKKEG